MKAPYDIPRLRHLKSLSSPPALANPSERCHLSKDTCIWILLVDVVKGLLYSPLELGKICDPMIQGEMCQIRDIHFIGFFGIIKFGIISGDSFAVGLSIVVSKPKFH